MKKLLFISLFAALLLAGCKKEKIYEGDDFPPTEQVPGDDDGDNQDDEDDDDGDDNNGDNPDDEDDDDGDDNNGENPDDEDDDNKGIPDDEIWYTSSDGNIVEPYPYSSNPFGRGAEILSNIYEDGKGVIKFNAPVTEIGYMAFNDCSGLTSVTIPNSVTTIGGSAFSDCTSLTTVTIPDSVTEIGSSAFAKCSSLTAFYGKFASEDNRCLIVDGVLNSFAIGCGAIEYTIPDSVTTIGGSAFYGCRSLTSVTIPDSVTTIGGFAFYGCTGLTTVTIPDSVTTIGGSAFSGCYRLTSVTIGNSVTTIGGSAFIGCSGLTSVTIPDGVTTIGSHAFEYCSSLTSITIPDSVTAIGDNPFYGCLDLTAFYGKFASDDNRSLIVDGVLNSFAIGCGATEYTIPDGVSEIGYGAFYSCRSLTSITIPDGVTTIGDSAFNNCDGPRSITIPNSVTTIGNSAFAWGRLTSLYCSATTPPNMGSNVFYNSDIRSLTDIYVPRASVEAYKTAENWSEYADLIQPYDF